MLLKSICSSILICLFSCFFNVSIYYGQDNQVVNAEFYSPNCLVAPEGFETKENFPGYIHMATKSSIIVSIVKNRTIIDAEEALNEDYFQREKVTLVSKENIETVHGEKGLLYKFSFEVKGEKWLRYSLFLGDLNNTLWVNANYLVKYESVVEEELRKSLLTTKFKVK